MHVYKTSFFQQQRKRSIFNAKNSHKDKQQPDSQKAKNNQRNCVVCGRLDMIY